MSRANSGLSNHVKDTCRSRADRSTLIKAQLSALNVATHKRDIGYDGGYTLQPVCARPALRRLEAEDCDSIRCAQLISGGRRRIRPPCTVPRSRSPHNVLHTPSNIYLYTWLLACRAVPCRAVHPLPDVRGRGAAVDLARHKGKGGLWWYCHITRGQRRSNKSTIARTKNSRVQGVRQTAVAI